MCRDRLEIQTIHLLLIRIKITVPFWSLWIVILVKVLVMSSFYDILHQKSILSELMVNYPLLLSCGYVSGGLERRCYLNKLVNFQNLTSFWLIHKVTGKYYLVMLGVVWYVLRECSL